MTKLRNWLAKKIADFAIVHIASQEYSEDIQTCIKLGLLTWQTYSDKESL